jgi:hypothetical protein
MKIDEYADLTLHASPCALSSICLHPPNYARSMPLMQTADHAMHFNHSHHHVQHISTTSMLEVPLEPSEK